MRLGRWHAASYAFREASRLRPSEPEYLANLALALGRAGRWSRAAEALHRLAMLCPGLAEPRLLLATALSRAGHPGRAIRALRESARLGAPPAGRRSRLGTLSLGVDAWSLLLAAHAAAARLQRPRRPIEALGGLWDAASRRRRRLAPRSRRRPGARLGAAGTRRRAG